MQAASHAVNAIGSMEQHLEVSEKLERAHHSPAEKGMRIKHKRGLKQIYDDVSREEAEKATRNVLGALQKAAKEAVTKNSGSLLEELSATLNNRKTATNLIPGLDAGETLSSQLQTFGLLQGVYDLAQKLFLPNGNETSAAPQPENKGQEEVANAPLPEPSDVLVDKAEQFRKNMSNIFSLWEEENQAMNGTRIVRKLTENEMDQNALVEKSEATLHAFQNIGESLLQMSNKTKEKIRKRAANARSRYESMIQSYTPKSSSSKGRVLSATDSKDEVLFTGAEGSIRSTENTLPDVLFFPGESYDARISTDNTFAFDDVMGAEPSNYDAPLVYGTQTVIIIPVDNTTDILSLINDVVSTMILGFSESMPVYSTDETFIEENLSNSTHLEDTARDQAKVARRKLSSTVIENYQDNIQASSPSDDDAYETYDIIAYIDDQSWFNEAQRQNTVAFVDRDAYILDAYIPDNEDAIYRLAIQMSAPVEEGGLPPALVQIMADDENGLNDLFEEIARYVILQSEHPSHKYSLFGSGDRDTIEEEPFEAARTHRMDGSNVGREDQESLANLIVEKISQSAYPSHKKEQQYYFDPRWFGLLFGFVCIVFLVVGTTITALRTESNAYMIVDEQLYQQPHEHQTVVHAPKDEQRSTHRKLSGLPA